MNVKEFAALKAGDRIANPMGSSRGEVVDVDDKGVHVRWYNQAGRQPEDAEPRNGVTRHYSVASTIWMHWVREEQPCDTSTQSPSSAALGS